MDELAVALDEGVECDGYPSGGDEELDVDGEGVEDVWQLEPQSAHDLDPSLRKILYTIRRERALAKAVAGYVPWDEDAGPTEEEEMEMGLRVDRAVFDGTLDVAVARPWTNKMAAMRDLVKRSWASAIRMDGLQQARQGLPQSGQCGSVYVGESGQELQMRMAQHRTQFNTGSNQSAFLGHTDCKPAYDPVTRKCFHPESDSISILAREQHTRLRLLTESAMIRTIGGRETILVAPNDANVNRNSGTLLDERWLPALDRL